MFMSITVGKGARSASMEEARAVIAGYAFGTEKIQGPFRQPVLRPRWAYRTYDCIAASEGDEFSDVDVLVAAGLNGRLDVPAIGALQLAVRQAAQPLAEATAAGQDFADLTSGELAYDPPPGTTGWLLDQAWSRMKATRDVGEALTHKVLHHKRPALFPLLDNLTAEVLSPALRHKDGNAWQQIHAEINESRDDFEQLREWFAGEAAARGSVALGLLRLHDILVWLHAAGQWEDARTAGTA
jgi:Family of unknown function (DUF6308)